jgi:hypothetical protein
MASERAAYPGLGSQDADPSTRASTAARAYIAAHIQLAMAAGALHRPLRQ